MPRHVMVYGETTCRLKPRASYAWPMGTTAAVSTIKMTLFSGARAVHNALWHDMSEMPDGGRIPRRSVMSDSSCYFYCWPTHFG